MKKSKQELIEEFLSTPMKEGDDVHIKGLGSRDKTMWGISKIFKIDGDKIAIKEHGSASKFYSPEEYKRSTNHIGANPFQPEVNSTSYNIDIESLLYKAGFDNNGEVKIRDYFHGAVVAEVDYNPIVVIDGEEVTYQRDYIWTLKEKQELIQSIYNNIEIGKFVFRLRSFEYVENRVVSNKMEHTAFKDVVDGKQRLMTLISFVKDEFKDSYGNYFSDFSKKAKNKFMGHRHLTYVELDENVSDKDVLMTFLAVNHTGVPQSMEHIKYVKTLYTGNVPNKSLDDLRGYLTPEEEKLLTPEQLNDASVLMKFYEWREDYKFVAVQDFMNNWFRCNECGSYEIEECICYAR